MKYSRKGIHNSVGQSIFDCRSYCWLSRRMQGSACVPKLVKMFPYILEYGNFRDLREKKKSHLEILVSCTTQTYDNVTKRCYPSFAPLSVPWSFTGG